MIMRVILILAMAGAVSGCGGGYGGGGSGGKTSVVAAFYPLAYASEQIGGSSVDVTNLTPPGTEPHDVELSVRDVEDVRSADVVFYVGEGFQPALERAVDVREKDPHVWLDPVRYQQVAREIGNVLDHPSGPFARRLAKLNADFRAGLARCERREIVTSHEAFGYLADRYGLKQIAITGISPEAEPTPRALERVIEQVRASGATTVFSETLLSPRIAETVARETGARTAVLNPIEGLTERELGRGENYFSLMRENLATLRKALGCR
jgi:zinc transport system substrate-binding protein